MTKRILAFTMVLALASVAWAAAAKKLGTPLKLKKQTAISDIVKNKDKYVNQQIQIKGKVTETCSHAGCYMMLSDANGITVKIKRASSDIVLSPELMGKTAVAEGKFVKIEMTQEEATEHAKFEAKERGIPVEKMKVETVIWQIESSSMEILN
jgi:hypothetical protein